MRLLHPGGPHQRDPGGLREKGIVAAENHCFRFRYDPLKRVPPRPAQLSTDGLKEEDFSL